MRSREKQMKKKTMTQRMGIFIFGDFADDVHRDFFHRVSSLPVVEHAQPYVVDASLLSRQSANPRDNH